LVALGIRHLGPTGARAIARAVGSLDALISASEAELAAVDGIGGVIAASVAEFLAAPMNVAVLERLRVAGVATEEPGAAGGAGEAAMAQTLQGKAVVVTGTVPGFTREEAEEAILARGGTSPGSVSKKTFAVVVGDAPGASKLTKADQLGTPVVAGADFARLLESGELPA
jgi:DNA ligase (NAD+)